ncbi:MAG: hypothetical protein HOO96_31025 [Polyangiaceae bacterium]|nr:hypothetical protein [Polyangiaceae bacterium]
MVLRQLGVLALVTVACGGGRGERAAPAAPGGSSAVQRLASTLRAASPRCVVKVEALDGGEARIELGDPEVPATGGPPMQLPVVHWFMARPFVSETEVAERRAREKQRFAECMGDAGSGPTHKGHDMHAEGCTHSFAGPGEEPAPGHHYRRELAIDLPQYFSAPAACEAAVARLRTDLVAYPP